MATKKQNPDADPENITSKDADAVARDNAVAKKQNEDSLREQEERDVNDKNNQRAARRDSGEPTGAHRHWTAEGGDVVTFDDEPPV